MFKKLFNKSKETHFYAPVNGKIVSLEDVPDPVFSQKMMGEGIAIIPSEGKVVAPVNGEIIQVAPTKHAIGILAEDGSEILIHFGLETVALNGEGFDVHVNPGDQVKVGQPLMDVRLNVIQEKAKDTITPIVITNGNQINKQYDFTEPKEGKAGETLIFSSRD
ncbi:PTS sugar transporter subunit IIA [Paucisalibacillus globulus]|uniref:PTS sugar transporter subunit IIA n=1 Tax=Paucisalibacillus globulus TaxID=351095 RepID=UPI0004210D7D|nr:PTS glucose transporter subunit IIA [Paucisalibacillus globulus]